MSDILAGKTAFVTGGSRGIGKAMAVALAEAMIAKFHDSEHGGFWQSAAGSTELILRVKDDYDGEAAKLASFLKLDPHPSGLVQFFEQRPRRLAAIQINHHQRDACVLSARSNRAQRAAVGADEEPVAVVVQVVLVVLAARRDQLPTGKA